MANATLADQHTLAIDATWLARVESAMLAAAITVTHEVTTTPLHTQRAQFAQKVLLNPALYAPLFALSVATDANVAIQALSPPVQGNVTDATIGTVLPTQWDSYSTGF